MEHLNLDHNLFLGLARIFARPLLDALSRVIIEWLKLRYERAAESDAPKKAALTASKRRKW